MAYIQDASQSFSITLSALLQGLASIDYIEVQNQTQGIFYIWEGGTWDATPQAVEGDNLKIEVSIENYGSVSDTLFGEFVSTDVTPNEALIYEEITDVNSGFGCVWTFTMPPKNVGITINAGHVE